MTKKAINNILVLLIIILSLIVTTYGIFSNKTVYENKSFLTLHEESVVLYGKGLYCNDSLSAASQARAQDIITLTIGIPFLIISLFLSNKGSLKGKLLLTGTIGYFLYTYISYSFLMTYNIFFLFYVILMSASFFCFVINITSSEFKNLEKHFKQSFPKKYIGIFAISGGAFLFFMWTSMILSSFKTVPPVLEHYSTLVIQAMDLGFIVPAAILSGTLLIKNKSLGYLLASIVIIKCTTLLLALTMMIVFMILSGVSVPVIQIIVFPLLVVMCIFNLFILLKNIIDGNLATNTVA